MSDVLENVKKRQEIIKPAHNAENFLRGSIVNTHTPPTCSVLTRDILQNNATCTCMYVCMQTLKDQRA